VDNTAEDSYRLFYLKNLAPVFRSDYAHLPLRRFPGYLVKAGWDLLGAWMEFSRERSWIRKNKNRFRRDAWGVADLWERAQPPIEESPGADK
jgi:hypothetical protein